MRKDARVLSLHVHVEITDVPRQAQRRQSRADTHDVDNSGAEQDGAGDLSSPKKRFAASPPPWAWARP